MRALTKKDVQYVWKQTCKKYGTRTINIRSYWHKLRYRGVLRMALGRLEQMGVPDPDEFLRTRYITVVWFGKTYIVTPVAIGSREKSFSYQCVVCAHEHRHHNQAKKYGTADFTRLYFLFKAQRANLEAQAKAGGADVSYTLNRSIPSADTTFNERWRKVYCVGKKEVGVAKAIYEQLTSKIRRGNYATEEGAFVANLLKKRLS